MKTQIVILGFFVSSYFSCNVVRKETLEDRPQKDANDFRNSIRITIPDFSDPEIHKYHIDYAANFIKLVDAIRHNDTAKARELMLKDFQFYIQKINLNKAVILHPERMQPADYQKEIFFLSQIKPLYNEIKNSESIKEEIRMMIDYQREQQQ